jgi:hypothetical protein
MLIPPRDFQPELCRHLLFTEFVLHVPHIYLRVNIVPHAMHFRFHGTFLCCAIITLLQSALCIIWNFRILVHYMLQFNLGSRYQYQRYSRYEHKRYF